ncbi:MAG: radical SAM protein [candidate division WOR-3 bacterium]|nr:MAG: radical SAM protein [candidate division WOR-3 bacterium]
MPYRFVTGVNDVRNFKDVLGIDFSPKKTCTFDCINCISGRTNILTDKRDEFHPPNDVFSEIETFVNEDHMPEHVLLTGSGEPTLYAGFGTLARMIKERFPDIKVVVYSNFSLLDREEVRREVGVCDIVAGNFYTVCEDEFKKIYRPIESIRLQNVMDGMKIFRNEYDGVFMVDTRFFAGINDTEKNLDGLREFMEKINPHKYYIIDAKYGGNPLPSAFIDLVKSKFDGVPFEVEYRV